MPITPCFEHADLRQPAPVNLMEHLQYSKDLVGDVKIIVLEHVRTPHQLYSLYVLTYYIN